MIRLNAAVPEVGDGYSLAAGPLRVDVTAAGELRIGWDESDRHESDWLGPARLVTPNARAVQRVSASANSVRVESGGLVGEIRALADAPIVVLRLEATESRQDLATDGFAHPAVAWRFDPRGRADGGAPDGLRAFGYQYTEFALPVFSDAAMAKWRLLPFRPRSSCPSVSSRPTVAQSCWLRWTHFTSR